MGLFSSGKNPADKAMPYLSQIPGAVQPYYQPYIDRGQTAGQYAGQTYDRMANDPMQYLQELMNGYTTGAGFNKKKEDLLGVARNAAAGGGYAGLPFDQEQQTTLVNALMNDDMQQWLQNVLGIQGTGLMGQQHQADQGYNASTGYGDILGGSLNQMGGLAFQGQQQRNQDKAGLRNTIAALLGGGAGWATGGGNKLW